MAWGHNNRRGPPAVDIHALASAVKDRHNLSDIIGRHTTLKRRGREMAGLCPFHSEKTASFEVNDAKGTYHCHGCGAGGDAISFLMGKEGLTFRQAIETLTGDAFPVISEEERTKRKADDAADLARRRDLARAIWGRSVPALGTPAEVYARSRGITIDLPPTVRFAMTPRWFNHETGEAGRDYPAMVCALQDGDGALVGVQCVFLAIGGRGKLAVDNPKLTFGTIVGSAFRLGPDVDHVHLCEGPEDGLTLRQLNPDATIWVSCGTAMMSRVRFPGFVSGVTLAGDNGRAGRRAVDDAIAVYLAQGLAVDEVFPDPTFKDWNDQLRGISC